MSDKSQNIITYIITSYNCKDYINGAIRSCMEQKGDFFRDIIVIDDCSADGTYEHLVQLSNKYKFRLLSTKKNSGPSSARNLGINNAVGSYICFLDGDDYLLPSKTEKELMLIKKHPDLVGVFCDSKIEKNNGMSSLTLKNVSPLPTRNEDFLAHLLKTNCIAIHAALIKTSIAKKILFDESLRRAEDYDFWLRLVIAHGPLLYLDEPLVVYRKIKGGLSSQIIKTIQDNIIVLDKIDIKLLNDEQAANLRHQKAALIRTVAHDKLRHMNKDGFNELQKASSLEPLPRSQSTVIKLSKKTITGALLAYQCFTALQYFKRLPSLLSSRSNVVREFNR